MMDIAYNPSSERVFEWPDLDVEHKRKEVEQQEKLSLDEWYKSIKENGQALIRASEDSGEGWDDWLTQLSSLHNVTQQMSDLERECEREAVKHVRENLLTEKDYMTEEEGMVMLAVADWYASHTTDGYLQKAIDIYRVVMEDESIPCHWYTFYNRSIIEVKFGLINDAKTHLAIAKNRAPRPFSYELRRQFTLQEGRIQMANAHWYDAENTYQILLREDFKVSIWKLVIDCRVKQFKSWNLPLSDQAMYRLAAGLKSINQADRLFKGSFRLKQLERAMSPEMPLERLEKLYKDGEMQLEDEDEISSSEIKDEKDLKVSSSLFPQLVITIEDQKSFPVECVQPRQLFSVTYKDDDLRSKLTKHTESEDKSRYVFITPQQAVSVTAEKDDIRSKLTSCSERSDTKYKQSLSMIVKCGVRKVYASPTIKVKNEGEESQLRTEETKERSPVVWTGSHKTSTSPENEFERKEEKKEDAALPRVTFKSDGLDQLLRTLVDRNRSKHLLPSVEVIQKRSTMRGARLRCSACGHRLKHAVNQKASPKPVTIRKLSLLKDKLPSRPLLKTTQDVLPDVLRHDGQYRTSCPHGALNWSYRRLASYRQEI